MNAEELDRLLEKYYKGKISEEDEMILKEYFTGNNIPDGYEAEKEIFRYYFAAGEEPEPSTGFESRILAEIDNHERKRGSYKIKKYLLPYMSAAAGLIILAGSYFFFVQRSEPRDTFTDPEVAYAETMKILMSVSAKLNYGARALEPVNKINELTVKSFEAVNKSALIIEKNLKSLTYLQNEPEITDMSEQIDK